MIIVMGFDNTGKSTLAHTLSKDLELKMVRSIGPNVTPDQQKDWVVAQLTNQPEKCIFDRFPIFEELVYGKILRGKCNFTQGDPYYKLLKKLDPVIIYCRPSNAKILNFGEREQMDGVISEANKLIARYDELAYHLITTGWKLLPYSYEHSNIDSMISVYKITQDISKLVDAVGGL